VPSDGEKVEAEVRAGDIVLMATDGVLDNLFDDEIGELLANAALLDGGDGEGAATGGGGRGGGGGCADEPSSLRLAKLVATRARSASLQKTRRTPFEVGAREAGYKMSGGKLDDVTVLCVRVLPPPPEEEDGGAPAPPRPPRSRL